MTYFTGALPRPSRACLSLGQAGATKVSTTNLPSGPSNRFTASAFLSRNRVSPKEAFEGLELCEGKLSCTVLRGLDGSNPVRLLGDAGETITDCGGD